MRRTVFCAGLGLIGCIACGSNHDYAPANPASGTDLFAYVATGTVTKGVSIAASVVAKTPSGDSVVIHIANAGTTAAFMRRCGSGPLILGEQFSGGVWTGGVQNFMCLAPSAPGPVQIAPGQSVDERRVFSSSGRYRFIGSISSRSDLSDAGIAASNAFDVP